MVGQTEAFLKAASNYLNANEATFSSSMGT